MLYGNDTSVYQSSVPKADFGIIKATEGLTYTDAPFVSRARQLKSWGEPRGAYHFAHPSEDPIRQAEFFLSKVDAAGFTKADKLFLDHESLSLASPKRMALAGAEHDDKVRLEASMSAATRAQWAAEWCAYVTKHAWKPGVYTYLGFAWAGYCDGLGGYELWIADPSSPAGHPRVPSPWHTWSLHQYSSAGNLDRDVFNGTRASWVGAPTPTPPPPEEDSWFLATST